MENSFVVNEEYLIINGDLVPKEEVDFPVKVKEEPLDGLVPKEEINFSVLMKEEPFEDTTDNDGYLERETRDDLSHISEKLFTCFICKYSSRCRNTFKIHINNHNVDNQMNLNSDSFYEINTNETVNNSKRLHCSICMHKSSYRGQLKTHIMKNAHMRTHTGEKSHTCSVCDYKTEWAKDFKEIMNKCTGEKPFSCSVCDYKTAMGGSLMYIRTDTNGKSSLCCI